MKTFIIMVLCIMVLMLQPACYAKRHHKAVPCPCEKNK